MPTPTEFKPNEQLQHPGKPEWGVGTVVSAQPHTHEGTPCQRLTVRFTGAGKKTINTAFAKLVRIGDAQPEPKSASRTARPQRAMAATAPQPTPSAEPDKDTIIERLAQLPGSMTDPFRDLESRLIETLESYRNQPDDRGLLQWASIRSGLADPMSVLNRHELEEHFANHRIRLDRHLKSLLDEARRAKFDTRPIIRAAPAGAQHAIRRINPAR